MTDPMPPIARTIWRQVPQVGQDAEGQFADFLPAGGRIYADVSPMLRHPIMGRLFLKMMGIADTLAQSALEQAVQSSRFRAGHGRLHLVRLLWSLPQRWTRKQRSKTRQPNFLVVNASRTSYSGGTM